MRKLLYEAEVAQRPSVKGTGSKELEIKFAVEEDLSNVTQLTRTVRSKSPNVQTTKTPGKDINNQKNVLYSVKMNPREYEELQEKKAKQRF